MATTARPRRYTGEILLAWQGLIGLGIASFVHKLGAISRTTDQGAGTYGPVQETAITIKHASGASATNGFQLSLFPTNKLDANGVGTYDTEAAVPPIITTWDTGAGTTLSAQASTGSTNVSVTSASGFAIGDQVLIKDGSVYKEYRIVNIVSTTITLDRNADAAHASGSLFKKLHVYSTSLTTRALAALRVEVKNLDTDTGDTGYCEVVASGDVGDEIG